MGYNPNIHNRKSIRLKGYDYSQAGMYFITICVQDRRCLFGKIENDEIMLNDFGIVANEQWVKLAERFTNFELDVFQIMPNHMHGIILLTENVGAGLAPAPNNNNKTDDNAVTDDNIVTDNVGAGASPAPTLSVILLVHTNHWWRMNVWHNSN